MFVTKSNYIFDSGTGEILRPNQIKISLAQHDLRLKDEGYQMQVKHVITHPDYNCNKVVNDIAMLKLNEDIGWSKFVRPACVANEDTGTATSKYDNIEATVTGWGWLSENTSKYILLLHTSFLTDPSTGI